MWKDWLRFSLSLEGEGGVRGHFDVATCLAISATLPFSIKQLNRSGWVSEGVLPAFTYSLRGAAACDSIQIASLIYARAYSKHMKRSPLA